VTSNPGPDIPTLLDEQALARLHADFASTGDLGELAALIRNFLARGAEQVDAVSTAVAAGDAEAARQAAHKLKGSSQTLGASLTGAVAAKIEAAGREGDLAAASRAVPELEVVFSLTRAALEDAVAAIGDESDPTVPESQLRVVVADDEQIALAVLRAAVERLGHDCTPVTDGDALLEAYARLRPHVVITDVEMPGIGGLEVARRIRDGGDAATYIALLSAGGDRGAGAVGNTVDAGLSKPVREDELRAVLGLAAQRLL
jgi:CheY-like chemotaxis protein